MPRIPRPPKPMKVEDLDRKYDGRHYSTLKPPTRDFEKLDRNYAQKQADREPELPALPEENE